jgi:IclR family transcriptional regulator, KDG regulon repressor
VLSSSPGHAIEAAGWVGHLVPAYCSSSGRALLLDHTPTELRDLIGKVRFLKLGPNTPRSLAELSERIELARARGYATVDEEFEPGLVAASAPVRDFRGRIVAALNVSAPKFRLGDRLEEAGAEAARAADALSDRLGWKPQQPVSPLP